MIRQFIDDELLRAPLTMDMAMQGALEAFQRGPAQATPSERQVAGELMLRLASYRPRVVDAYVGSLRAQVNAEQNGLRTSTGAAPGLGELSLVDDDEVSVDVVISHAMEAIKSVAEHELREMLAYTSALAGDMDVGADHNPFRAETQARALWAAAQALPQSRGHQIAFMRHLSLPFAQSLRKGFAAACTRLEGQGVVPAAYRTVIPPSGPRRARSLGREQFSRADDLYEAVEAALTPTWSVGATLQSASSPGLKSQVFERVGRLFGAMMNDRQLHTELHAPISRMQSFVLQSATRDPAILDKPGHALWRFIDQFVHVASVYPGAQDEVRAKALRFTSLLLDQLGEEAQHTEPLYAWALERIEKFAANRLETRCEAAQAQIKTMQALDDRLARTDNPVSTFHGALDVAQLDTVPADLLDLNASTASPRVGAAEEWLALRRAGEWMCVFRKGGWVNAQLLWPGERAEVFLFGDGDSSPAEAWAIRRSALLRLREEGLVDLFEPRSLLADATEALAHQVQRGKQ